VPTVKVFTIGIDATNLRGGGGVTHLVELLRVLQPGKFGIGRVVVWGGASSLALIEDRPWLGKFNPPALDKGLLRRTVWQRFNLAQAARDEGCDVLFVPGGSYAGNFHPVVTMSRNLLPFEMPELRRYGWTLFALKLRALRLTQSHSFKKTDGVIFLTEYARDVVLSVTGKLCGQTCIVPHGLNPRFSKAPKVQRFIADCDDTHPYRLLYVSIVDQYKHQWHVVEAVAALRKQGFPVVLDLVGPAYPPALKRLNATLDRVDAERRWVHYQGAIAFDALHHHYAQADLGLFASSCENMPNILLETMASGLPIACSNRGPMPEVMGEAGVYFDPEQPEDITRALRELIVSPELRTKLAQVSYARAQQYSWTRCANETFAFVLQVAQQQKGTN
jgi:glycosyltransferase involved in cell wall biosynthesis